MRAQSSIEQVTASVLTGVIGGTDDVAGTAPADIFLWRRRRLRRVRRGTRDRILVKIYFSV